MLDHTLWIKQLNPTKSKQKSTTMDKITKSNNAQKSTTMDKITKSDNARSHTMDEWPHPTKSRQKYTIQDRILWIKSLNPNRLRQNYNANSTIMYKMTKFNLN